MSKRILTVAIVFLLTLGMFSSLSLTRTAKADDSTLTYSQFIANFKDLADDYSSFVTYNSSGKTYQNNDTWTFYIGNGPHKLMINGEIHGWEYYGSLALYYFAQWLFTSANSTTENNATATRILNDCTLIVTPAVNPDRWWTGRKNANNTVTNGTNIGVDLNRNFAPGWGNSASSSSDPNNETYKGTNPLDQNETKTMSALMEQVDPLVFLDLHVSGARDGPSDGTFMWDGNNSTAFNNTCTTLYDEYLDVSNYQGVSTADSYPSSTQEGDSMNQALQWGASASYTFEITNGTNNSRGTKLQPNDIQSLRMYRLRAFIIAFDMWSNPAEFALKTQTDGYFFVPSQSFSYIKVEETFTNSCAIGDQVGLPHSGYTFSFPNNVVGLSDLVFLGNAYGSYEGDAKWNYQADLISDGHVNLQDLVMLANHYGNQTAGTWYNTNMTDIWIGYDYGGIIVYYSLDLNGFVPGYQDSSAITVCYHPDPYTYTPIGAMLSFWS